MKIERTKNASRNIIFGFVLKIYQMVVPFLMRTAMIYYMGVQYLGLNSLFTSVLQVLNLAELGVGSAMVFSMYKPIAEDDETTICALMKLYQLYYRVIGGIIAVIGIVLTPFIPHLIKGDIPDNINVYVLYLLNLGATVLSYWLFAYKNSILQAHQRTDVISKVTIVINTILYVTQFCVLAFTHNYYLYVIALLLAQALTNISTAIVSDRLYPRYKAKGNLPKESVDTINKRIRDLFTSKLGGVIVNSADTIVISAFLGLTVLAVYQNYYYILTAVIGFVAIIFSACTAGIGNSLIVETKQKNYSDFKKFTFLISWIAGFGSCCFLNLFQPFMKIWVGDSLTLNYSAVICFTIYYFIYEINQLLNTYKDAGGIWHKDRFRPLITALANLAMNLILVNFWGIYGVLLSTVISMLFIGMPWIIHNLFTTLFEKEQMLDYVKKVLLYAGVSLCICAFSVFVCNFVNFGELATLIIRIIICIIIPNAAFVAIYHKTTEYKEVLQLMNNMTKGKMSVLFSKLGMK